MSFFKEIKVLFLDDMFLYIKDFRHCWADINEQAGPTPTKDPKKIRQKYPKADK